jgi:acyl-coenzyme A thioesterase PaaI-like protein
MKKPTDQQQKSPHDDSPTMTPHEQVLACMREMSVMVDRSGARLRLPPPSSKSMGTRYVGILSGKMLTAKISFNESFSNPTGVMQGGFLCAAFDEVFGPLSYMTAGRPVVTIEMSTSCLRPFHPLHKVLTVRADVVFLSRAILLMEAKATRPDGKLIAVSKATCSV